MTNEKKDMLDAIAKDYDSMNVIAMCLLSSSDFEFFITVKPDLAYLSMDNEAIAYLRSLNAI